MVAGCLDERSWKTRALFACGVISGPLFVVFLVAGLLTLAFAIGLRRAFRPPKGSTWGLLLAEMWAVGVLGAEVFGTDP